MTSKPLEGLKVIELGQLLAGPFAGCMLGYFGAEVIKVEPRAVTQSATGARLKMGHRCGGAVWGAIKNVFPWI